MSAVTALAPAGASLGMASHPSGRISVRERVLEKVVRETSAQVLCVPRDDVRVALTEWGRGLVISVAAKLPIPDLADDAAVTSATPVLQRLRSVQEELARECGCLTGRTIERVSITVTGAVVPTRKRVR